MDHPCSVFLAALLSAVCVVPLAAHAGDVVVDYNQLSYSDAPYPMSEMASPAPSVLREPIRLRPPAPKLALTPPSVLSEKPAPVPITLRPPAPKMIAAVAAPAPTMMAEAKPQPSPVLSEPAPLSPPITTIDIALAALPPAAPSSPSPPVMPSQTAAVVPPVEKQVPRKAKPVKAIAAAPNPESPKTVPSDYAPATTVRVRAITSKLEDLRPEDVVGLDFSKK